MLITAPSASIRVLATFTLALCMALASSAHAQGSIIQVTTTADTTAADGFCSLREAIMASNTNSIADGSTTGCQGTGIDSIRFGLGAGNPSINIGATPLPTITDRVTIAGNTGGATRVELRGPGGNTGLQIGPTAGSSTLRFLVMSNFLTAIHIEGAGSVLISSYIGTDATGMIMRGNGTGVLLQGDNIRVGGTTGTTPGGACTGECNLISGNTTAGIKFDDAAFSDFALIQGNFIGTNVLGEAGTNMGNGVGISGARSGDTIGGASTAARNVISGNAGAGIGGSSGGGTIQGNYIGTNSAGTAAVPNLGGGIVSIGLGTVEGNVISGNAEAGVKLFGAQNMVVRGNLIGTAADGVTSLPNYGPDEDLGHGVWFTGAALSNAVIGAPGNVIAFNQGDGVRIDDPAVRITVRYNSIHDNGGLGINLSGGGNAGLLPPTISAVTATSVSGNACINCVSVDVYSDLADEGRIYEGSAAVQGTTGNPWTFNGALTGPNITATGTDINGNTSEFTAPIACPDFDDDDLCNGVDDSDADGVVDDDDNCIVAANGPTIPDAGGNSQLDTDNDFYGNICDADLNNTGLVTAHDYQILRNALNTSNALADLNGSGLVTAHDYQILRNALNKPPGPSGTALVPP
jgi:CSLREA domain-containing protein